MFFTYSMVSSTSPYQQKQLIVYFFSVFLYEDMSKRSSLFSLVQEYHNRNEDSEEDSDIGYEEDCFGWDADDNVDFQPHQVDNGWDEISDNEQQQQQQQDELFPLVM